MASKFPVVSGAGGGDAAGGRQQHVVPNSRLSPGKTLTPCQDASIDTSADASVRGAATARAQVNNKVL
jgi:hypothetical protein